MDMGMGNLWVFGRFLLRYGYRLLYMRASKLALDHLKWLSIEEDMINLIVLNITHSIPDHFG
jgi:hypothetical protein